MSEAAMTPEELQARETKIKEREDAIAADERKRKRKTVTEFAEAQADAGRILPRHIPAVAELMLSLPEDQVEFAEGDETRKETPETLFREFIESLPEAIEFGERSADDLPDVSTSIRLPAGCVADPQRVEMMRKAKAYQAQHKCEFSEAVDAVDAAAN